MKVVYFDYWVTGIQNFVFLDKELKSRGIDTLLFHIGSFNSRLNGVRGKEEIEGIKCVDIAYFNTKSIFKALKSLKPDVVITLNTNYILDRVVCLACRELGIRSVFMMHGERLVDKEEISSIQASQKIPLFKKILKAGKYLYLVVPNYLSVLWRCDKKSLFSMSWMIVLVQTFLRPMSMFPSFSSQLVQDICLVYSNRYRQYYQQLGYSANQIYVVGNPKHESLFNRLENDSFTQHTLPENVRSILDADGRYALYIEDAFVEQQNFFGWTADRRNEFIQLIAAVLKEHGVSLVVKLHPATRKDSIFPDASSVICSQCDLDALIYFSSFCIGFSSTVLTSAVLLNKVILVPRWGWLENTNSRFLEEGMAQAWCHPGTFEKTVLGAEVPSRSLEEGYTVRHSGIVRRIADLSLGT